MGRSMRDLDVDTDELLSEAIWDFYLMEEWERGNKGFALQAWGDQCFFNSAIRSIEKTRNTGVMDHYHKLVVTLNPGQQNVNKFRPATSRADTKPARTKEANAWKRAVNKAGDFPYMSMGKAVDVPMDFLHPKTLTDIGLGQYEKIIKFYRLRALPTIRGHFATDRPVVITQMRFKSLYHAFEWCRRYKLNFEVRLPTRLYEKKDFFFPWAVSKFKLTPKVVKHDRELDVVELHIWSDRNDTRNASPYRGEACVYIYEGSYWRTADTDGFNADPYVCDRMHGGCSHCGLCASLDGTGPTIQGVKFCNELNVLQGHLLAPFPGPEGAGYLGFLRGEHVETDEETGKKVKKAAGCDLFAANLQKLGIEADVPMALRGWAANPQEPADLDDALVLLQSAADYLQKVDGPYFCEGWNTHENAETSIAFAAFSVMCYAKQQGWDCDKALTLLYEVADAASPDFDMLDDMDGLDEDLWEGVSPWNDVFGEVG